MDSSDAPITARTQAAFVSDSIGPALFLWVPGEIAGSDRVTVTIDGAATRVLGRRILIGEAICIAEPLLSPSLRGYFDLIHLARELLRRESIRPIAIESKGSLFLNWGASLDANERSVLAAIVARMPPAAFAASPTPDATWVTARAFLDVVIDHLVRAASPLLVTPPGGGLHAVEEALARGDGKVALDSPRLRRIFDQWERQVRDSPKPRLVLHVDPPTAPGGWFSLEYRVELRDDNSIQVGAADVWAGSPRAHRLADDLVPIQRWLRETLHRVGRIIAPVEASLANAAPPGARLSAADAWAVIEGQRSEIENHARVTWSPAFEGLAARFPKSRIDLRRADGDSPDSMLLASRYVVRWEVASGERTMTASELREAAVTAPLAFVAGTWLPITAEAAERLARVIERPAAEWTGPQALAAALAGAVRLPGDLSDAAVVVEPGMTRLLEELRADAVEAPAPKDLKAELRHYQARGVGWLFDRTRLGLGALLADDMGLGKTIQLIALLLSLRERGGDAGGPTLIVCPASLVGNWERELSRFAPTLKIVRHHGGARHRDAAELMAQAGPHDVVLTTYSLVRRDAALRDVDWGTVVCDEAQNIKNPGADQARAVRTLKARRRIALTGTPVENRLTDLWGLMEFLNPGLLGTLEKFRREIAIPLERDRDARALRWLQSATSPFLLRRLKSHPDIAPELPEKQIIRVFCALTEEQARLYKAAVDESLVTLDDAEGIERSGRVLKLLTSLKQICNHPAHYLGDSEGLSGRSGKLERAAEMLEEIVEAGERALVFTQYVEMGNRLCDYFGRRLGVEIPFFHGGLALPVRDAMVRRFQEDSDGPPVLVLSLRAGGVGLNLTRATHVMHYDRWWNPAVEDQATDRAHRIGQKQTVQVHHLLTLGTLEERIDRMLEDKRGLADAVVAGGESWIARLSTDELRALVSLGSDAAVESIEAWSSAST